MSQVSLTPDAPAPASSAGGRVSRPALAAAMAVGQVIGVLPVCFMIGGPRLALRAMGVVVALTVIVELIASRKAAPGMSTAKPQPRHYVFAAAGASFHGLVAGYMWLGLYWMIAGLIWILRATTGWPAVPDVWAAAATPSIILAIPMVTAAIVQAHGELTEQLCPNRAGVDPVFETGALSTRVLWALTAGVLGIGVLLLAAAVLQYQISWLIAIVALFAIMMTSVPLATLSSTESRPGLRDVLEATKTALEKAGCEVLPAPRTGDPSLDPLLADLSLYVRAPGRRHAFAIDIKASPTGAPLDWTAASSLKLKVSALISIESRDTDGDRIETITPVLVALTPADDSLRAFARDHQVMLFEQTAAATQTAATETEGRVEAGFASDAPRGTVVLGQAAIRSAAQNVPALIRTFIEQSVPRKASASSANGESGGAVARV